MNVSDLAQSVSRAAWCQMLINSADPALADPRLPTLPSEDVQKITNNLAGAPTMRAAATIYENTANLIAKHNPQMRDPNILDFGCGWGRIARFLPQITAIENIYGTDVDAGLIKACQDHLHAPNYVVMTSGATLPYPDQTFDVVLSNSVFSHLSESSHRFHVSEIARVLKPGGLFLGSILSEASMAQMYDASTDWITRVTGPREQVETALARKEFVYSSTGRWTDYGIAFIPAGWTKANWAPALQVIDQLDGAQQVNVARRVSGSDPKLRGAIRKIGHGTLQTVKRTDTALGFAVSPRRGVLERRFAWLGRCRRMAKDWEKTSASAEAWLLIVHMRRVIRMLVRV